jgi:cellulose synthase/poly-beta-1,6-N-acetylglucosamine synthase-like glycosyltransferase
MSTSKKVTSPNPVCSIVLRAFNEEKHIGRLLSGILEQKTSDVEIILVDSGSTDWLLPRGIQCESCLFFLKSSHLDDH